MYSYGNEPKCCDCCNDAGGQKEMTTEDIKKEIKATQLLRESLYTQTQECNRKLNSLYKRLEKSYRDELLSRGIKLEGCCIKQGTRYIKIEEVTSFGNDYISCKTSNVDTKDNAIVFFDSHVMFQEIVENKCTEEEFNDVMNTVLAKLTEKYGDKGLVKKRNINHAEDLIARMDKLND